MLTNTVSRVLICHHDGLTNGKSPSQTQHDAIACALAKSCSGNVFFIGRGVIHLYEQRVSMGFGQEELSLEAEEALGDALDIHLWLHRCSILNGCC